VILDSGTTTAEIAKQIRMLEVRSINVITNALNVAALLADVPSVRLILSSSASAAAPMLGRSTIDAANSH
jgi:DeoR/GlpR family transcriptional regulator of sugar metabolism